MARGSLANRGMDPDLFPSLRLNVDLDEEAGRRAQESGMSSSQWQTTSPEARRRFLDEFEPGRRPPVTGIDPEFRVFPGKEGETPERALRSLSQRLYSQGNLSAEEAVNQAYDQLEPMIQKHLQPAPSKLSLIRNAFKESKILGGVEEFVADPALGLVSKGLRELEKRPGIGGPLARTPDEGFPHYDPEGRTAFERGAEMSRPIARQMLTGLAEPAEQGEMGFESITGIRSRGVSGAIKGDVSEDILTEVINPAAIVLVAPLAGQGIRAGMSTRLIAAKLVDNLIGTGMTPEMVQGSLRVLSAAGRRGISVGQVTKSGVGNLPEGWRELPADPSGALQAEVQSGPVSIQATKKPDDEILWVDLFSAEDAPIGDMMNSFREVGRFVAANPERTFHARVTNEKLRKLLRRAKVREVEGEIPEFLIGAPQAEIDKALTEFPTFEFGLDDIARFFPEEAAEVLGGFENLQKVRTLRGGPPSPTFKEFQRHLDNMNESVSGARKAADYIREEVAAGRMGSRAMDEATVRLADARRNARQARKDLNTARYKNAREEILEAVRGTGADERVTKLLADAFDDSVSRVPSEELLLGASASRRWINNAAAHITGTPPGVLGRLAHHRDILLSALRRNSGETVHPVFKQVQKLLRSELGGIKYVGPKKWVNLAEGEYKMHHIVQHPEWFDGMSPALKASMDEAQGVMRTRLETAKTLGYPIEALDDAYLEQLWEIPHQNVGAAYLPGRVSVAKPRLFDDYFTGLTQGFVPQPMSVEELMQHSTGLLDQAISDAWMKQEVVRRFGTKTPGKVTQGRAQFSHALYKDWYGPQEVVSWLDEMEQPVGRRLRQVSNIGAATRGTVFGIADIAVTGVQLPLSLAHGGLPMMVGAINRSLNAVGYQPFHLYMDNQEFLGRAVQATSDGLHIGLGPSAVQMRGGTLLKYFPQPIKWLDKPISKAIDIAAQAQFGYALSHVRLRMYEGNLIALKMAGEDITQKAVRRQAAEWANSATGASRGAMVRGRRTVESIALTSTQMTRANLSVYGQLVKSLSPAAGKMERLRAAMTLVNLGAYVYGTQYLFNTVFGEGPMEWIPGRSNWGTIRVGNRTVPIIPQRSVLRGIDKSIKILSEEVGATDSDRYSMQDLFQAWSQVAVGKANPLVQAPLAAAGYGFEPGTGKFELGGLSSEGRIVGMAPVPPLAEQAGWQERDELSLAIAGLGFNPYDTSSGILLREEFANKIGEELNWESPAHRQEIDKDSRMSSLWEKSRKESAEYGSEAAITSNEIREEIAEAEETKGIVRLAEAVQSGDSIAAANWSEARKEFLIWRAGKWDNKLTGRAPRTEIGRLVEEYYSISPESETFTDSSGVTNWEAFNRAREEVLDKMPTADATAIRESEKFDNPVAEAVDKQFRDAQDELRPFWQVEDEVFGKLRRMHDVLRPYQSLKELKDAKAQELLRMGFSQEDLNWQLNRVPILSEIRSLVSQERIRYRAQNPDVDALLVKWYGNTPIRERETGRRRRPRVPTRG